MYPGSPAMTAAAKGQALLTLWALSAVQQTSASYSTDQGDLEALRRSHQDFPGTSHLLHHSGSLCESLVGEAHALR